MNYSEPIKVIVGDLGDSFGQIICDSLSDDSRDSYTVETTICARSDELIEHVRSDSFDLAILVLNNIIFSDDTSDELDSPRNRVDLVSELKHRHGLPVIAFYGLPRDESLASELMDSGADFASLVPCKWEDISNAFDACLRANPRCRNRRQKSSQPR